MSDVILDASSSRVLESYCTAFSVDQNQRERLARLILELYEDGAHTDEELSSALDREIAKRGSFKIPTRRRPFLGSSGFFPSWPIAAFRMLLASRTRDDQSTPIIIMRSRA